MRRAIFLGVVVGLLAPGSALAADSVTLTAPARVTWARTATFTGTVTPAAGGESVRLYRQTGPSTWALAGTTTTKADGSFSFQGVMKSPATFLAMGTDGTGADVQSAPVSIAIRPLLSTRRTGSRTIGARLYVRGRLVPKAAGSVNVRIGSTTRKARLSRRGYYRVRIPTTRWFRYRAYVRVKPSSGYTARRRVVRVRVRRVSLGLGSSGVAARWLDKSLAARHYALAGVDRRYGYDTRDAVLAFQKVHGLARTGYFPARLWRVLRDSGTPRAHIRRGNHIEVSKPRQLLYEVRDGKVVRISHVSTGATGNTPVGHFHVYWKSPGFNGVGMYYSMFFTGAFAIHGYHSVPAYQASHGCVRTPLWYAPRIFSRWGVGTSVYVFG